MGRILRALLSLTGPLLQAAALASTSLLFQGGSLHLFYPAVRFALLLTFSSPRPHCFPLPVSSRAQAPAFLTWVRAASPHPIPIRGRPAFRAQLRLQPVFLHFSYLRRPSTSFHGSLTLFSIVISANPSGRFGAPYFRNPEAVTIPSGFTCTPGTFGGFLRCPLTPLYLVLPILRMLGLIASFCCPSFPPRFLSFFHLLFSPCFSQSVFGGTIQPPITLSNDFIYTVFFSR